MAGRPKVIETEEFQQAVSEEVAAQLAKLKADMLGAAAPATGAAMPADGAAFLALMGETFQKLNLNLQSVGGQGQFNKPLSPDEVLRRESALKKMEGLLLGCRDEGAEKPEYKLIGKIYFNERFIEPYKIVDKKAVNNIITWTGIPNDAMVPLNDIAKEVFAAWRETTGGPTKLVPTADQRPLYVTAAGLTVRGEPPKRQHVAGQGEFKEELAFSNSDPAAPEVAVLGTVAAKARQNSVAGAH